jgi:hypothetical protein
MPIFLTWHTIRHNFLLVAKPSANWLVIAILAIGRNFSWSFLEAKKGRQTDIILCITGYGYSVR